MRFSLPTALLVLEREATYRAGTADAGRAVRLPVRGALPQPPRLRRRADRDGRRPVLRRRLAGFIEQVRRQVGVVDFADLVYLRSEFYVQEQRRHEPELRAAGAAALRREGRARSPGPTAAATRSTCSRRCSGSSATPRCRGREPRDDVETQLDALAGEAARAGGALKLVEGEVARAGRPEPVRQAGFAQGRRVNGSRMSQARRGRDMQRPLKRSRLQRAHATPTAGAAERLHHFVQVAA